ncbi:MAG: tRNA (guanosine(46)-N7)-methyltransferase TrmB [Saprospiraceae bacterium]|nr:tRNA (guanosine(46)-N7)-methyltransferase TrmB [Saprospiraceae bacterium]MBK9272745.1 tRNA (guanosine(46)-N7)-methyltransferase TrmB [Saprospiraceae bacterium]
MVKRSKLEKFAANLGFTNVFENFNFQNPSLHQSLHEEVELKGKWRANHFMNNDPLILELACGRGEYCLGLAAMYPNKNYIGVDIKGARIWKGASTALAKRLDNIAFLRTKIELIGHFFEEEEISEIWITFPDPFPRPSKSNRRLTSPIFLDHYSKVLEDGAYLHLKTDDPGLYVFSLQTIQSHPNYTVLYHDDDIYGKTLPYPELEIKTYYENIHLDLGKKIKYIRARHHKQYR